METFAYLHLCTAHEEADLEPSAGDLKLFEGCNWQPPSSAWIRLMSIVMALSILSLASSASAYTARVSTNGSDLNVRTGPGLGYRVVEDLPNRTRIRLNGNRSDGWSQLSRVGDWVSSYWISRGSGGSRMGSSSSSTRTRVVYRNRYSPYIATLQQRLKEQGYFKGRITGFYGSATEAAVRGFQTNNNLPVDGIAGVLGGGAVQTAESPGPTQTDYGYRTLQYGSKGKDVRTLQKGLQDLGYLARITGVYDRATESAVRRFQENNNSGYLANGIADPETQRSVVGA